NSPGNATPDAGPFPAPERRSGTRIIRRHGGPGLAGTLRRAGHQQDRRNDHDRNAARERSGTSERGGRVAPPARGPGAPPLRHRGVLTDRATGAADPVPFPARLKVVPPAGHGEAVPGIFIPESNRKNGGPGMARPASISQAELDPKSVLV